MVSGRGRRRVQAGSRKDGRSLRRVTRLPLLGRVISSPSNYVLDYLRTTLILNTCNRKEQSSNYFNSGCISGSDGELRAPRPAVLQEPMRLQAGGLIVGDVEGVAVDDLPDCAALNSRVGPLGGPLGTR